MAGRRKEPLKSAPWFVEALFQLPLSARQALVSKFNLPVAPADLILPTDEVYGQSAADSAAAECTAPRGIAVPSNTSTPTVPLSIEKIIHSERSGASASPGDLATPTLSPSDELEADALRALMGYGRLARQKDGQHEC